MVENINVLIKNKIEKSGIDKEIKTFLNKILSLELQHRFEGGRWKYSKEYERLIKEYSLRFKGNKK